MSHIVTLSPKEALETSNYSMWVKTTVDGSKKTKSYAWGMVEITERSQLEDLNTLFRSSNPERSWVKFVFIREYILPFSEEVLVPSSWEGRVFVEVPYGVDWVCPSGYIAMVNLRGADVDMRQLFNSLKVNERYFGKRLLAIPEFPISFFDDWKENGLIGMPKPLGAYDAESSLFPVSVMGYSQTLDSGFGLGDFVSPKEKVARLPKIKSEKKAPKSKTPKERTIKELKPSKKELKKQAFNSIFGKGVSF